MLALSIRDHDFTHRMISDSLTPEDKIRIRGDVTSGEEAPVIGKPHEVLDQSAPKNEAELLSRLTDLSNRAQQEMVKQYYSISSGDGKFENNEFSLYQNSIKVRTITQDKSIYIQPSHVLGDKLGQVLVTRTKEELATLIKDSNFLAEFNGKIGENTFRFNVKNENNIIYRRLSFYHTDLEMWQSIAVNNKGNLYHIISEKKPEWYVDQETSK